MPMLRIPLVGSLTNRAEQGTNPEQIFSNCFPEIITNSITNKTTLVLTKRPGLSASADVSSGAASSYGGIIWSSTASGSTPGLPVFPFVKSGGLAIQFFFGNGSGQVGADVATTGTAQCLYMNETDISGTGNLTASILDGSTLEAWYFPNGGSWTQVTDGDFPSNILSPHAHLDGYWFVMTEDARIFHSDLNNLGSWNPLSYITASSFGDHGIGCARFKNYIVGFGDSSLEFFYNAGNATGSVLNSIPDATVRVGSARPPAAIPLSPIRELGGTVYWIGVDGASGARGVYRIKALGVVEKISTPQIDKWVSLGQVLGPLGSFSLFGLTHIAFFASFGQGMLCYCPDTKFWWFFNLTASATLGTSFLGAVTAAGQSQAYLTSGARIYSVREDIALVWQDATSSYSMSETLRNMDMGTRQKKVWESVSVIADKQTSSSVLNITAADEDSGVFTNFINSIDLSSGTLNKLTRCGASRRRSWKLTHSTNTACRIEALELEYRVGKS